MKKDNFTDLLSSIFVMNPLPTEEVSNSLKEASDKNTGSEKKTGSDKNAGSDTNTGSDTNIESDTNTGSNVSDIVKGIHGIIIDKGMMMLTLSYTLSILGGGNYYDQTVICICDEANKESAISYKRILLENNEVQFNQISYNDVDNFEETFNSLKNNKDHLCLVQVGGEHTLKNVIQSAKRHKHIQLLLMLTMAQLAYLQDKKQEIMLFN